MREVIFNHRNHVLLFWLAMLVTFSLAMVAQPPAIGGVNHHVQQAVTSALTVNDKMQHLLAFATLAGLALLAWPTAHWAQILIGLAAYGGLIEIAQATPMIGGDVELADWIADISGLVALLAATGLARRARMSHGFTLAAVGRGASHGSAAHR
jgi:hypothetical protein